MKIIKTGEKGNEKKCLKMSFAGLTRTVQQIAGIIYSWAFILNLKRLLLLSFKTWIVAIKQQHLLMLEMILVEQYNLQNE